MDTSGVYKLPWNSYNTKYVDRTCGKKNKKDHVRNIEVNEQYEVQDVVKWRRTKTKTVV